MDEAARLERELAAIEEARAQVARGEVVTLEEVEAWIESIGTDHELPLPAVQVGQGPLKRTVRSMLPLS